MHDRLRIATAVLLLSFGAVLAACGGDGDRPTLTWYVNPDPNPPAGFSGAFGQAGIAERCSTDEYRITTESLPASVKRTAALSMIRDADGNVWIATSTGTLLRVHGEDVVTLIELPSSESSSEVLARMIKAR